MNNPAMSDDDPVLRIEDLLVRFNTRRGPLLVVGGVSLALAANEVVGIVGESGSGKTLTGLSVLGLAPPGAVVSGHVWFQG